MEANGIFKMILGRLIFAALVCSLLVGCSSMDNADANEAFQLASHTDNFAESDHGWVHGFADYPAGENDSAFYELKYEYTTSPATGQNSILLSGNNHSDDLFMYLKKKLENLRPGTAYTITFDVQLASDAPAGSTGAGGSPGESVYLKAGASAQEPKSLIDNGKFVMNIDKGNQSFGGNDMIVIGNIATPENATGYTLINRTNGPESDNLYQHSLVVSTNPRGELWLIVGTDSGYEGVTSIYYSKITAVLSRSN
jgi:hypothetical protein